MNVRALLVGAAAMALLAPAVQAQTMNGAAQSSTAAGEVDKGHYLVFFDWSKSTLTVAGRDVVGEAAAAYQGGGQAQISVVGHTDSSGAASYNLKLSERRAEAVRAELVRLGVPPASIATTGRGQDDPLVPTADFAREPQNRRVEIILPTPPAPAPVALAPEPVPPPPLPVEETSRYVFSVGPLYGHNFGETDSSGGKTQNDLLGPEFRFKLLPSETFGITLKQAVLHSFNGVDDGFNGRTGISLDLSAGHLGPVSPYVSANFGGIYGPGVQDGLLAGPELGLDIAMSDSVTLNVKAAYDYQLRNQDWDKGIAWAGLGLIYRF